MKSVWMKQQKKKKFDRDSEGRFEQKSWQNLGKRHPMTEVVKKDLYTEIKGRFEQLAVTKE